MSDGSNQDLDSIMLQEGIPATDPQQDEEEDDLDSLMKREGRTPGGDGSPSELDSLMTQEGRPPEEIQDPQEEGAAFGPADATVEEAGSPDREMGRFLHGLSQYYEAGTSFFAELPKTVAWIAENTALGGPPRPPTEEEVKNTSFSDWLVGSEQKIEELQENPLWRAGERAGEQVDEIFPENPEFRDEFLATMLPRAAGDMAALASTSAITGGGSTLAKTAALGASTQAPRAFKQAKKEGASDKEAMMSFYTNLAIGGLEGIPLARGFSRIDRATGGGLVKAMKKSGRATVAGMAEESTQEAVATSLSNASAKAIYDESRGILENVPESAAAGALLGGSLNGVGVALNAKLAQADTRQEVVEAAEARELLRSKIDQAVENGALERPKAEDLKRRFTEPKIKSKQEIRRQKVEEVDPEQQTLPAAQEESTDTWVKKFSRWMRIGLEEKALYPQSAKEIETRFDSRMEKEFAKAKRNIDTLNRVIKSEFAGLKGDEADAEFLGTEAEDSVPDAIYEDVTKVLRGESDPSILPEKVRVPTRRMRNHIDRLSTELINKGIAEGEVVATIKKNLGAYLTRAYRKDSDAVSWELKDIPERTKVNAMAHIKKQFRNQRGRDPSEAEVRVIMEELLNMRDLDQDFATAVSKSSLNWGPLKKRGQFPEPIRALWGEYTDGALAYAKTIEEVSNLVHGYDYYNKLRTVGLKEGWLVDPDTADAEQVQGKKWLASEGSEVKEPIAGLVAEEPLARALTEVEDMRAQSRMGEIWARVNGTMKFAATVGNQITHIRNFAGGAMMQLNQGVNPFNRQRTKKVYQMVKKDLGLRGPVEALKGETFNIPEEVEARIDRARELGLMDQSVRAGDLMGVLADAERAGADKSFVERVTYEKGKDRGLLHSAHGLARRSAESIGKLYQAEDNFHRLMYWMAEADRYSRAFHDKPFTELEGQQKRRIEEYAGNLARRNYQNYSQVPTAIKRLRRNPVMGTFVSFPYEVARTTANTTRTWMREVNHSNPEVRKIGWKRMASQAAVTGGLMSTAGAAALSAMQGVGLTDQEDEDLRQFLAPWDENGALGMVSKNGMEYEYLNFSYLDPYNMIGGVVRRWARQDNPFSGEAIKNVAEEMATQFEPFYSTDLLAQKVEQVISNEDEFGGQVYYEESGWGQFAGDITAHFAEGLVPQILQSGTDLAKAHGIIDPTGGKDYDVTNEWLSAFGMRVTKVDTEKSFEIEASRFADRMRKMRKPFNAVKFSEDATFSEKLKALRNQNERYANAADTFVRKIDAIYRLGLTEDQIKEKMVDAGIPKKETKDMLSGFPEQMLTIEDIEVEE